MRISRIAAGFVVAGCLALSTPACLPPTYERVEWVSTANVYDRSLQCLSVLDELSVAYLISLEAPTAEQLIAAQTGVYALARARIELVNARELLGLGEDELAAFALLRATDEMKVTRAWLRSAGVPTDRVDVILDTLP